MGKGRGGGSVQATTSKTEPWSGQMPYLESGFRAAHDQILGRGQNFFPGSTVAPMSGMTQHGLNSLFNYGNAPSNTQRSAAQAIFDTTQGGYLNANPAQGMLGQFARGGFGANPATGTFQYLAGGKAGLGRGVPTFDEMARTGGGVGPSSGFYNEMARTGAGIGPSQGIFNLLGSGGMGRGEGYGTYQQASQGQMGNLATGQAQQLTGGPVDITTPLVYQTAAGGFLNANPYLDRMMNRAAEGVTRNYQQSLVPGVDTAFSRAGRMGSGMAAYGRGEADRQLGDTLGNLATDIYGTNYAQERQLQQQAQGLLGQLQGQNFGQQLQATGLLGQLSAGDIGTRMAGAQGLQQALAEDAARRLAGGQAAQQAFESQQGRRFAGAGGAQQAFADQMARRMAGAQSQQAAFESDLMRRLAGAQGLQSGFDTEQARRLSAAQSQGQLYDAERGRMLQAAGMAPMMQGMELANINAMLQAGGQYDAQAAEQLQDQINRFNFYQQEPTQRIGNYMSLVGGGNYGSQTSQQVPMYRNRGANIAGGALTGLALGGPWGAAIGGLGGLFM